MKSHEYEDLVRLLDTEEWRPLLPAIFHLAWRQCSSTEQSHRLITAFSKLSNPKLKSLLEQHQRIDVIEQSLNLSRFVCFGFSIPLQEILFTEGLKVGCQKAL